ncbi:sugar ABC transporter permease [Ancylobacter sp. MQZ15Z-1]|uniref:Sugar ABC transporter permease n=1 Tax=Ancylobacter mangrovi TaxID=2972472 RepID=A0A9X2PLE7_9HYPH|nr:sugar ABC transporter permease [Ancylobacter mangrovi]MCS0497207.1 sugar ABC transporter permease [Ancylobacter mangrovi]
MNTIVSRASPYLLLTPAAVIIFAITLYPIVNLFWIAFHATNYFQIGSFNAGANFFSLFNASGMRSFVATAIFVIASDVLALSLAIFLALLLEAPLRNRGLLRTVVMVPWLVSQVVTALLWQAMLDANFGPLAHLAQVMFGVSFAPLGNEFGAMASMVIANVWRSYPFALVLMLAALQSIPSEMYEAARIDGATRWQEFRYISLPMAGQTAMVVLILLTFEYFTLVTIPFIMTSGGPNEATYLLSLRVWREAFTNYHFGYSAAAGVVVFCLNLVLALVYIRKFAVKGGADVQR